MTCRDEVLEYSAKIIAQKGYNEFTVEEMLACMKANDSQYAESTIRTHVTSRMCKNAPENHQSTFDDLERIDRGVYKLLNQTP